MKGSKSKYNCYMWTSHPSSKIKSMEEITSKDADKEVPKVVIEEDKICGVCQIVKMSHKIFQHPTSNKIWKLLFMNLIEYTRVKDLGGRHGILYVKNNKGKFFMILRFVCQTRCWNIMFNI